MRISKLTRRILPSAAVLAALACLGDAPTAKAVPIASDNLDVAASVNIACTIVAVPVVFGTYAPGGANASAPLDGTGGVSVNCTGAGGSQRVTLGQGLYPAPGSTNNNPLRRMSNGAAARLSYNLYSDAAHTSVWNNNNGVRTARNLPQTVSVYGRIPAAQPVPSGAYTDSILATITF